MVHEWGTKVGEAEFATGSSVVVDGGGAAW
jgi:hypothetical protein